MLLITQNAQNITACFVVRKWCESLGGGTGTTVLDKERRNAFRCVAHLLPHFLPSGSLQLRSSGPCEAGWGTCCLSCSACGSELRWGICFWREHLCRQLMNTAWGVFLGGWKRLCRVAVLLAQQIVANLGFAYYMLENSWITFQNCFAAT